MSALVSHQDWCLGMARVLKAKRVPETPFATALFVGAHEAALMTSYLQRHTLS